MKLKYMMIQEEIMKHTVAMKRINKSTLQANQGTGRRNIKHG